MNAPQLLGSTHALTPVAQLDIDGPAAHIAALLDGADAGALERAIRGTGSALPGSVRIVVVHDGPADVTATTATPTATSTSTSTATATATATSTSTWDPTGADPDSSHTDDPVARADDPPAFGWLARPDVLTIASISADASGAGLDLALSCDIRIASTAARFRLPAVPLGQLPVIGCLARLVDVLGYATTLEFALTGRVVTADEALGLGLISHLVEPGQLPAATAHLVDVLLDAPRSAATEWKALVLAAASGRSSADPGAGGVARQRLLDRERAAHRRLSRERAGFADG